MTSDRYKTEQGQGESVVRMISSVRESAASQGRPRERERQGDMGESV